jgi:hypothetical protein
MMTAFAANVSVALLGPKEKGGNEKEKLTSNKLANAPNQIQHALAEVADKGKEAGKQADEAADKGVHDGVGGAEDGREQLADGLDEVGYGAGDGHFGFLVSAFVVKSDVCSVAV